MAISPVFQTGEDRIETGTGYINIETRTMGELVESARKGDLTALESIYDLYTTNQKFMNNVFPDVVKEFLD